MKNIYTTFLLLCACMSFFTVPNSYAMSLSDAKAQILQMNSGEKLLTKIDIVAEKIATKTRNNDSLRRAMTHKLDDLKEKYSKKTDTKSQKIVIILSYLDRKISLELGISSSRIIDRFQKAEADKYQNQASSRVNKAKVQNYQRIHIKK